jgi:hypothetical protein
MAHHVALDGLRVGTEAEALTVDVDDLAVVDPLAAQIFELALVLHAGATTRTRIV